MKRLTYLFWLILLCLFQSCSLNKDEWAKDSNPVGVMYFDGVQLRERGGYGWNTDGYYGINSLEQNGESVHFRYSPRGISNKNKTIIVYLINLNLYCISEDRFDGGIFHYTEGDYIKYWPCLRVLRNNIEEFYGIKEATVIVSDIIPYNQTDNTNFKSDCRIDYSFVAIDSLEIEHKVEGWAIPANRERL